MEVDRLTRRDYQDEDGRWHAVLLPAYASPLEADRGIPLGPPSLAALGLPRAVEVRLSNELFHRGLLAERDARRNLAEVQAALMAALRVDAALILDCYTAKEENHADPPLRSTDLAVAGISDRGPRRTG